MSEPWVFLLAVEKPDLVPVVDEALRSASIPCHTGLQLEPSPMVVFTVPASRETEARETVEAALRGGSDEERDRKAEEVVSRERATPPWGALQAVAGLVLVHLAILFTAVGREPTPRHLAEVGGLVRGGVVFQPWRLLSSIFLHADVEHVLWNALSMAAFAVPLLVSMGYARTAALYLVSGIAGGMAAIAADPAAVTVGSSGAVAGLFGAWLARTIRRAHARPPTHRALLRTVGVGLLVLPSLLTPTTADGKRISVAAHVGGMIAGAAFGLVFRDPALGDRDAEVS